MNVILFLFILASGVGGYAQGGIFDYLGLDKFSQDTPVKLVLPGIAERSEQYERLKSDYAKLTAESKERTATITQDLAQVNQASNFIKDNLKVADPKEAEFLTLKLSKLNELSQILFNISLVFKDILGVTQSSIKLLEEFLKDHEYKNLALESRNAYTFEQLHETKKRLSDEEYRVDSLMAKKADAQAEVNSLKKKVAGLSKRYDEKKTERAELRFQDTGSNLEHDFTLRERTELLEIEEKIASNELQLAELRLQLAKRKLTYGEISYFVENEKIKVLNANLVSLKGRLRVTDDEIAQETERFEKTKTESLAVRDTYYDAIRKLTINKERLKGRFDGISKGVGVAVDDFKEWIVEAKTVKNYENACELGNLATQISLIESKIELYQIQIDYEQVKVRHRELMLKIMKLWHGISNRRFSDNDELNNEIKHIRELNTEIARDYASFNEKRNAATHAFGVHTKQLGALRLLYSEIVARRDGIFKEQQKSYLHCLALLNDTEKLFAEKQDIYNKYLEVSATLVSLLMEMKKEAEGIIHDLEAKYIWQRSEYAISWHGVTNIGPDIERFWVDLKDMSAKFMTTFQWSSLLSSFGSYLTLGFFVVALLILAFLAILYRVLRAVLSVIQRKLAPLNPFNPTLAYIRSLADLLAHFCYDNLWMLYVIVLGVGVLKIGLIQNSFLKVAVVLFAIPYLLYLVFCFVNYAIRYNTRHDHVLFGGSLTTRVKAALLSIFCSGVLLLLFRQAFMLVNPGKSELPTILLATYSILLRIFIIFSIGKDEILSLIPSNGSFWGWITDKIERYYYFVLAAVVVIMIVSDPYIGGYRNLVSYILWGTIASGAVLWLLSIIHAWLKGLSTTLFFETDEEETHTERFSHARTLYGIYVISLFLLFVGIGIFISAYIWGFSITYADVVDLLNYKIYAAGKDEVGNSIYITPFKLLKLCAFIASGFIAAFAVNRYVWRRIFDVLPVDLGVQDTLTSFTRYFVIILGAYIGFNSAGLETLLIVVSVVVGAIGYVMKEPIGDFISYFIILVQRPFQIGDYIILDNKEFQGFVRHITPRSVILRRKNSLTIVIPNSMFITKPVNNICYGRNFLAVDDIILPVEYTADVATVKAILLKVCAENFNILKSPAPIVRLESFAPEGYIFMVRGFISNAKLAMKWDIASDLRYAIAREFKNNNIEFGVPSRVLVSTDAISPRADIPQLYKE